MTVTTNLTTGEKKIEVPDLTEAGISYVLKQVVGALHEAASEDTKKDWTLKALLQLASDELGT